MSTLLAQVAEPQFEYTARKKRGPYKKHIVKRKMPRPDIAQPCDPAKRNIALTKNQVATVDLHLYDWLMESNWHARWDVNAQSFYAERTVKSLTQPRKTIRMHDQIVGLSDDDPRIVDHRSGDSLLNTGANLRITDAKGNQRNKALQRNNKSGYKGVSWDANREQWIVGIAVNGKHVFVGRFNVDRLEDAGRAYDAAARKYHGEFAWLNFPNEVLA